MNTDFNQRYSDGFSIREENGATVVSGLAIPFFDGTPGSQYELEPGYYERISPDLECNLDDVEACIMHERKRLIGMTPDTLKLRRTNKGIEYDIILDDSTDAKDAKVMVQNRKLKGASMRFMPLDTQVDGKTVTLKSIRLDHIALVSRPAYANATAYLRFIDEDKERELTEIALKKYDQWLNTVSQETGI